MKREWADDELIEYWTLLPNELEWLTNKTGATRLGFAALLKYFQQQGCFPYSPHEVPAPAIAYLARQVGVAAALCIQYDWAGRAIKYHRAQIRTHLGFREATVADAEVATAWLCAEILPHDQRPEHSRNPEEDLPDDFEAQRETYYAALLQPLAAEEFINQIKWRMADELAALDQSLPKDPAVRILTKGHGWISLSPLEPQPEAVNLTRLKAELMQRWLMTSLLDILKETDLRTGFIEPTPQKQKAGR